MIRCPHWPRLLEHRFDPQVNEPEDWSACLEHLEHCEACRLEAFGADPTLALLNLPTVEVSDDEVRRVHQAVMTLRQGLAIAEQDSSTEVLAGKGLLSSWNQGSWQQRSWRMAATVALTASLGLVGLGVGGNFDGQAPAKQDSPTAERLSASDGSVEVGHGSSSSPLQAVEAGVLPAAWQAAPIVEEVGSPAARVYSYPQEETDTMTLVMIIDPEIEV